MGFNFRIVAFTAAALIASGCATVDMTEMASPVAAKAEVPAEKNIVLRAAGKLYAAFRTKGFAAKTSRKRMQSAASILLNGLEERELTTETNYEAQRYSRDIVIADIAYAEEHVRLTANAAEIYFEMSEGKKKLRDELGSLEQALVSSREAAATFEDIVGPDSLELRNLNAEIDRLKSITDDFGRRVREGAAAEMAARRKETS